jgi:hypothetical protein
MKEESFVLVRLQRLQALFKGEILSLLVGPEGFGNNTIRAEDNDETLFALFLFSGEAGQIGDERQRRHSQTEIAKELSSRVKF